MVVGRLCLCIPVSIWMIRDHTQLLKEYGTHTIIQMLTSMHKHYLPSAMFRSHLFKAGHFHEVGSSTYDDH